MVINCTLVCIKKLVGNIKNDNVYVRSKQEVQDKVGLLENYSGNIKKNSDGLNDRGPELVFQLNFYHRRYQLTSNSSY